MSRRRSRQEETAEYEAREEPVAVKPEELIVDYRASQRRSLREVVNENIVITAVEFRSGRRGEFVVISAVVEKTGEEGEFYTFSKPVVEELKRFTHIFEQGKRLRVRVCLEPRKGYMYLCEPVKQGR